MNNNEYLKALELFLKKIESVKDTTEDIADILAELCEVLRVAKVEVSFKEAPNILTKGRPNDIVFFDMGIADDEHVIEHVCTTPDRNTAVYKAYLIGGAKPWEDDERDKIALMLRLLFVFNGRTRLGFIVNKLTFFDTDLEIGNIRQFMHHTGMLCGQRRIGGHAAIYLNLKRFTQINQQLGRDLGTVVMRNFAHSFDPYFFPDEMIGRIGGDNFIMLVREENLSRAIEVLNGTPIPYGSGPKDQIMVSAKAGVYVIPQNTPMTPNIIMDRVGIAAAVAKSGVKGDIVFYDESLMARKAKNMDIAARFPKALENEDFKVFYQPKISINDLTVVGAEALCRWFQDGKIVPPNDFIPVLEQNMDICRLDFYMLDHVCMDLRRWLDEGRRVVPISVNLSRRHLGDSELLKHILEIVDRHNIPHQLIEIELTETTTDVEFKDLREILNGLQKAGISTSVDDFGVGYSSLNLIKELPWDVLKLDKVGYSSLNLIKELPWDVLKLDKSLLPGDSSDNAKGKRSMFRHVVEIAQEMGLSCIAEGVETRDHVQVLRDSSCNIAQGFYFDKPLPVEEFEKRLDNYIYSLH